MLNLKYLQRTVPLVFQACRRFSIVPRHIFNLPTFSRNKPETICSAIIPQITCIPSRGFKDKDVLTKRCKDCYFQKLDGRWYVFCNTHPRHKQRQRIYEKDNWIITHSTHGVKKF